MSKKKTKEEDEQLDECPFVSKELVEFLKTNIRYEMPHPDMHVYEVYYNAGKQAVIKLLEELSER